MKQQIDALEKNRTLSREEYRSLLTHPSSDLSAYLFSRARAVKERVYGKRVYMRGLIEFSNYCANDCYYCGIRRSNRNIQRYRLDLEAILSCCAQGYALGFRTFVLQDGEDAWYTDARMTEIVAAIHRQYPDCAITLSMGERSRESYAALYEAGARRYLLRHETANEIHYGKLHPETMQLSHRMACLQDLKEIGYQVGCGFMVGSPGQTIDCLIDDLFFIQHFQPQMVGIGPFIPHKDTPFAEKPQGTLEQTLFMLALVRLIVPEVLLPATTALGSIHPKGRELALLSGANVVMPNLSPTSVRDKYMLYNNKICVHDSAVQCRGCLENRMQSIDHELVIDRGDCAGFFASTRK